MLRYFVVLIAFYIPFTFAAPKPEYWDVWDKADSSGPSAIDHSSWADFLTKYLRRDKSGTTLVDYGQVSSESERQLSQYIGTLTSLDPRNYPRHVQMAYWINLYNALTVQHILTHYPVDSIRDTGQGFFSFGPWDDAITEVAGISLTLNDIEHRILRPIWKDARIHYAVNCASIGCPNLRSMPFTGANLDVELDQAATTFINQDKGVNIEQGGVTLSSIYDWYAEDFGDRKKLLSHLTAYLEGAEADVLSAYEGDFEYEYDWDLNDAKRLR